MSDPAFANPQFDHSAVHRHGHAPVTYGGADDALWVEFYPRQVLMGFASEQAGREIHEERVYIKIIAPGSNGKTVNDREANAGDRSRFPRQWAFYNDKNKDVSVIGTPLTDCTFITRTLAEDLKSVKIITVEQLASLDDNMLGRLGPGYRQHKAKAVAFLDAARTQAPLAKIAAENEALRQHNETLQNNVADLMRRMEIMEREKLYQQPQPLPQHQQAEIERDMQPRQQAPFFAEVPNAREAYQQALAQAPVNQHAQEAYDRARVQHDPAPVVNKGGRPRGSKNKSSRKRSTKPAAPAT